MTADRRAELDRRLAALKAGKAIEQRGAADQALLRALAPMLDSLRAADQTFELLYRSALGGDWIPDWVPWGWSEMPWHLAPRTRAVLTDDKPDRMGPAIAGLIAELAEEDRPVILIFEADGAAIRLSKSAAIGHSGAAVSAMSEYGDLWIVSPPAGWLIRCEPAGRITAYQGAPETPEARAATFRANRAGRATLTPRLRALVRAGIRYRLDYPPDPKFARWPGPGPFRPRWEELAESLRIDLRTEPLMPDAADFIARRSGTGERLRLSLNIASTSDCRVPDLLIDRGAVIRDLEIIAGILPRPLLIRPATPAKWLVDIGPVMLRAAG